MYKAKNVDTDKALEAIRKAYRLQSEQSETRIKEERAYIRGVEKGLDIAESIFTCSNYEKSVAGKWIAKKDSVEATYTCPVCGFEITFADPEDKFEYKGCPICLSLLGGVENAE